MGTRRRSCRVKFRGPTEYGQYPAHAETDQGSRSPKDKTTNLNKLIQDVLNRRATAGKRNQVLRKQKKDNFIPCAPTITGEEAVKSTAVPACLFAYWDFTPCHCGRPCLEFSVRQFCLPPGIRIPGNLQSPEYAECRTLRSANASSPRVSIFLGLPFGPTLVVGRRAIE